MSDWHLIISCIQYTYIASLNILDLFRFSIEDGQGSLSTNAGTNCSAEQLKAPQLLHPYHFHGHIAILYPWPLEIDWYRLWRPVPMHVMPSILWHGLTDSTGARNWSGNMIQMKRSYVTHTLDTPGKTSTTNPWPISTYFSMIHTLLGAKTLKVVGKAMFLLLKVGLVDPVGVGIVHVFPIHIPELMISLMVLPPNHRFPWWFPAECKFGSEISACHHP